MSKRGMNSFDSYDDMAGQGLIPTFFEVHIMACMGISVNEMYIEFHIFLSCGVSCCNEISRGKIKRLVSMLEMRRQQ